MWRSLGVEGREVVTVGCCEAVKVGWCAYKWIKKAEEGEPIGEETESFWSRLSWYCLCKHDGRPFRSPSGLLISAYNGACNRLVEPRDESLSMKDNSAGTFLFLLSREPQNMKY